MPKKLSVSVLMGGPSAERKISLITGKAICRGLDKKKYEILPFEIDQKRKILFDKKFYHQLNSVGALKLSDETKLMKSGEEANKKIDVVFIALHGTFGEDGSLQGLLESLDIPYTGSRVLASALAMNKVFSGQIYEHNGLPHPKFEHFKKDEWKNNQPKFLAVVKKNISYPCVLKPVDQGSAVGVSIVKNENELIKAVNKTIKKFPWLMAQKFIRGKEATCGIIEKRGELIAFPPTHILPNLGEFYDYKSKYAAGGSTHICPADFSAKVNKEIQELAKKAHKILDCRGMSRTDMFVADDGKIYVIETNTIPGMTPASLFPEAAAKMGISFPEMLDLIIEASI